MYPNPAAGFGWTNPAPPPYSNAPNPQNRQIGFCLDSAMAPAPQTEVAPASYTPGLFGFDLSNMGPSPNAPPAYPGDSFRTPVAPPPTDSASSHRPENVKNTNVQVTVAPARPSAPPSGINSYPGLSTNSTPHRSQSERTVTVSPARKPDRPIQKELKNKDDDDDDNGRRRRSSYQESLKDMAELMTDVQLTDDVLNDLRIRFDLNN